MRSVIAFVVPLLLLAACNGNDEEIAAKRQAHKKLEAQYQKLNGELADKLEVWGPVKFAVIPARKEWMRAKRSGDSDETAAAKQALDQAQAAANDVTSKEQALKARINELRDKMNELEDQVRRLGGRI